MNFNLVEMYNGLLRFNKHILNELAEGLKHLPNLDGVSKGDSLIINEQGNPAWGSAAFIPTFEFVRDVAIINRNANYNSVYLLKKGVNHSDVTIDNIQDKCYFKGSDGQDTDKAVRVLLLGGGAHYGSSAGSGFFYSNWVRSGSLANVGFFTTVKLD